MPSWTDIQPLLTTYGYPLLLPIAVVEGPIATVVAGVLCASGVFRWYWVMLLVVLGDAIGDVIFYSVGRFSGGWLARLAGRIGLSAQRADSLRDQMAHHGTRMLVIGKWTHALGGLVMIAAGASRMHPGRFMLISVAATLPKSALLLAVGMYAFGLVPEIAAHPWITLGLTVSAGLAGACWVWRRHIARGEAAKQHPNQAG